MIKVKITGDGTWIGKRLHIVTFGFTIIDEGSVAKFATGNHTVCILKESESYESLALGLKDIRREIAEISSCGITIFGIEFSVRFFLVVIGNLMHQFVGLMQRILHSHVFGVNVQKVNAIH